MRVLIVGAGSERGRWYAHYHLDRHDEVVGIDNLADPAAKAWHDHEGAIWPFICWKNMTAAQYIEWMGPRKAHFDLAYYFNMPEGGAAADFLAWAASRITRIVYEPRAGTEAQVVALLPRLR